MYQLLRKIRIPALREEVWRFISNPANLTLITPASMDFRIKDIHLPDKIHAGMLIHYSVKPLWGIRMKWITKIGMVEENRFFTDIQLKGPYAFWEHWHLLEDTGRETLMTDEVRYLPPLGPAGSIANDLFIRKKLEKIFDHRENSLRYIFPANA